MGGGGIGPGEGNRGLRRVNNWVEGTWVLDDCSVAISALTSLSQDNNKN